MRFHIPATPISPRGIDDAVNPEHIPGHLFGARDLEHSRAEFFANQIVVLELARRLVHAVAFEEILDNFRLADIGYGNDVNVVIFQREMIEVPPDLPQTHDADPDFPFTHLATSV
jgi:hypothetical protein